MGLSRSPAASALALVTIILGMKLTWPRGPMHGEQTADAWRNRQVTRNLPGQELVGAGEAERANVRRGASRQVGP